MKFLFTRPFLLVLMLFLAFTVQAQQNHFIYIQTENKQPFYVRLDNKLLSSSASGYVIVPRLPDGNHNLLIGFPKNEWPALNVTVRIDKKDQGYILRNFGDKGWGLFNLQTMEVIMGKAAAADNKNAATLKDDPFSNVLSNVVEDPSIKEQEMQQEVKPVVPVPEPKPAEEKNREERTIPVKTEPVVEKPTKPNKVNIDSKIIRLQRNNVAGGIEWAYLVISGGKVDTVRLLIETGDMPAAATSIPAGRTEPVKEEAKKNTQFIEMELPNPNAKRDSAASITATDIITDKKADNVPLTENPGSKPVMINSDCRSFATEDDFMKLRKKMAAGKNDDEMVAAARKVFGTKCFTTEQVKNLSVLFLKDGGKYKFFDAAYPAVSDSHNFSSLQALLTDEYFINRFKAMLRQ